MIGFFVEKRLRRRGFLLAVLLSIGGLSGLKAQEVSTQLPAKPDTAALYLFYLHGRIIEEQGLRPQSPRFGIYEYEKILRTFQQRGFRVISRARPRETQPPVYARKVVTQIDTLLKAGVPAEHITVVGASKGAAIAVWVSHFLRNPSVNFVLIAVCNPRTVAYWKKNRITLHGRVLSLFESSDPIGRSCRELFQASQGRGLTAYHEIELHTGLAHGVLYRPIPEWVEPTVEWAGHAASHAAPKSTH